MQTTGPSPLLQTTFKLSPSIYKACTKMMGERVKKRSMPRRLVLGVLFITGAAGFLLYLMFYLRQTDTAIVIMSGLLLLLGIFNLVYYPLLFTPLLEKQAEKIYEQSPYFKQDVTLEFYQDYLEEFTANGKNRIQWTQIRAVERGGNFYLLRLTGNSGIIIPHAALEQEKRELLEELFRQKLAKVPGGDQ